MHPDHAVFESNPGCMGAYCNTQIMQNVAKWKRGEKKESINGEGN
jgi:hypothetical protein